MIEFICPDCSFKKGVKDEEAGGEKKIEGENLAAESAEKEEVAKG